MRNILIGADPELFGFNVRQQEYISLHSYVPGSKEEPMTCIGGGMHPDGTAAEITITPAKTRREFINNIQTVRGLISMRLPTGVELRPTPIAHYTKAYYDSLPAHLKISGCSADYDAWFDGEERLDIRPPSGKAVAGGHIHIGWTRNVDPHSDHHMKLCCEVAKHLDYYLGVPSLTWDDDRLRKNSYGGLGIFRPKPYGIEYRSLSNAWMKSENLMGLVYDLAHKAMVDYGKGYKAHEFWGDQALDIYESSDKEKAKGILNAILQR